MNANRYNDINLQLIPLYQIYIAEIKQYVNPELRCILNNRVLSHSDIYHCHMWNEQWS